MKKPQVVKLNKAVAQTAFLLGDVCPCQHNISGLSLELNRCGSKESAVFYPTSIDEHGYVLFDWGNDLRCLDDGFYIGVFQYQCQDCCKVFFQLGNDPCQLRDVIHTEKSACDDDCAGASNSHCEAPIEMYVPKYTIQRGV